MTPTTQKTFSAPAAKTLPRLICVGYVSAVGTGAWSKTLDKNNDSRYIVQPIFIEGVDASRGTRVNFLYRPEQFVNGFQADSYHEMVDDGQPTDDTGRLVSSGQYPFTEKDAESVISVYRRHILARDGVSTLQGIAGSEEAFGKLAEALIKETVDAVTIEGVQDTLTIFVAENVSASGEPQLFIYELKQASSKTNEVDENGKPIYVKESKYDLDTFSILNEKNLKAAAKRAEKSDGKVKLCFDPSGVPF